MNVIKIHPNLTIVDFNSLGLDIDRTYYQFIIDDSGLKNKDRRALRIYCVYKTLIDTLNKINDYRYTIFYTNNTNNPNLGDLKIFALLKKTFPFIHLETEYSFEILKSKSGESTELANLLRNTHSAFNFSKFSRRKMQTFLNYRKIKIQFPA